MTPELRIALLPLIVAARESLQFGNLSEHSRFCIADPNGVIRTRSTITKAEMEAVVKLWNEMTLEKSS